MGIFWWLSNLFFDKIFFCPAVLCFFFTNYRRTDHLPAHFLHIPENDRLMMNKGGGTHLVQMKAQCNFYLKMVPTRYLPCYMWGEVYPCLCLLGMQSSDMGVKHTKKWHRKGQVNTSILFHDTSPSPYRWLPPPPSMPPLDSPGFAKKLGPTPNIDQFKTQMKKTRKLLTVISISNLAFLLTPPPPPPPPPPKQRCSSQSLQASSQHMSGVSIFKYYKVLPPAWWSSKGDGLETRSQGIEYPSPE